MKHIYYLTVHNKAVFQFNIRFKNYHSQGKLEGNFGKKLGKEFWEVQHHSLFCLK